MNGNIRLIGILVLGMVVLASVQVVGATGEVTWYWKGSETMYKDSPPTGSPDTVTLDPGESAWWYTDEAAQCDLTFSAGTWTATYWAQASGDSGRHRVYARLYVVHIDGSATEIAEEYKLLGPGDGLVRKDRALSPGSVDVKTGEKIAIEIEWSSSAGSDDKLTIYYNGEDYKSRLVSPLSNPAWPVPELSTLILFSVGLLVLAGYAVLTKRRR
ncbi:MAG: hypothetical protein KAT65_08835 [Methanophagales archaeon]|nr:hypothetical protein [Methanophagales archaeon]